MRALGRDNSVIPGVTFRSSLAPIKEDREGSLGLTFVSGFLIDQKPVRLAFALALYTRFLTGLSQPLGTPDMLSGVCHPSQTIHLLVSFALRQVKQHQFNSAVLHWLPHQDLAALADNGSHVRYTIKLMPQQQATVKFHGVFASHWRSLVFAPRKGVRRLPSRDSGTSRYAIHASRQSNGKVLRYLKRVIVTPAVYQPLGSVETELLSTGTGQTSPSIHTLTGFAESCVFVKQSDSP